MVFRKISLLLMALIVKSTLSAQEVTNVNSSLSGDKILIEYTLTGAKFNQKFNVQLYVSVDGGLTFMGPLKAVSGDIGEGIKSGKHYVYWDPYKDVNSLEGDVIFKVNAEVIDAKIERRYFVHYSGNYSIRNSGYTAPIGLSVGQIGKIGWYISARMNSSAFKDAQYDFNGSDVVNYDKIMYYEFDNDYQYPSFEVMAGITAQLGWNFFLYAGAGYGYQKYYWHINEFDYMTNELESNSYLNYVDYSESGVAAELGLIIKASMISFNVGYSTLNFSYSNIVFGIGVNF